MKLTAPKLELSSPTGPPVPGRGFYQLEEDSLYIALAGYPEPARYFSSIESDIVRFDIDLKGRLMTIEVDLPRRRWPVDKTTTYPTQATTVDIRFSDFRAVLATPAIATNPDRQNLMIRFSNNPPTASYFLADKLLCQIDADQTLVTLWVTDIIDDLAGQEIRDFRTRTACSTASRKR